jgi:hypothetical protein
MIGPPFQGLIRYPITDTQGFRPGLMKDALSALK